MPNTDHSKKVGRQDQRQEFLFNKRGIPYKVHRPKIYLLPVDTLVREWYRPVVRLVDEKGKWKKI